MSGRARKLLAGANPVRPWNLDLSQDPSGPVSSSCIGIGAGYPAQEVLRLATEFNLTQICQKRGFHFEEELKSSQILVSDPELLREYPLACILDPDSVGAKIERAISRFESRFDSSDQKRSVLSGLVKALENGGIPRTITEDVISVADEFFTNAMFNAPFVNPANHINPGVNRHDVIVHYEKGKSARLFMGIDDDRLVLGCEDPFGSLGIPHFLNAIRQTYLRGPAATMNFGPGGAGIGSYIIFNAGSSSYIGVWPGQSTIFCCVIPLGLSYRKRIELPKHLHWIQPSEIDKGG